MQANDTTYEARCSLQRENNGFRLSFCIVNFSLGRTLFAWIYKSFDCSLHFLLSLFVSSWCKFPLLKYFKFFPKKKLCIDNIPLSKDYHLVHATHLVEKEINAIAILDNGIALNISQLTSLIKSSSFVIANDTGPAHITAHTGSKGITLFGKHTTAYKVNIERENFKAIEVTDLNNLSADKVFERLTNSL